MPLFIRAVLTILIIVMFAVTLMILNMVGTNNECTFVFGFVVCKMVNYFLEFY